MKQSDRIAALEQEVAALKAQLALLAQQMMYRPAPVVPPAPVQPSAPTIWPTCPWPLTAPWRPPYEVTCVSAPDRFAISVN